MKLNKLPKNAWKTYAAFLIAHLIWAAASPIIKISLNDIPPFTFLLFRFALVCLILLPFALYELKKTPVDKRDIPSMIILGLLGQASLAFFFLGINQTSAIDAIVIGVASPLLGIFAGHHFFNERVGKEVMIGVAVASAGTIFVVLEPILNSGSSSGTSNIMLRVLGNLSVLLYNVLFTGYLLWSKMVMGEKSLKLRSELKHLNIKPMHKNYSPELITTITFYTALAAIVPLAFLEHWGYLGESSFTLSSVTLTSILGLLYMVIMSSIVAYFLFQWGLNASTVGESAILGYLAPIMTMPFAYLILGDLPSNITLLGSIIIATGVLIAEAHKTKVVISKKG